MPTTRKSKKRLSQSEKEKKKAEVDQLEARTRQAREALAAAEERSTRPSLPPMTQLVMALKVLAGNHEAGGGQTRWVEYNKKLMEEGVLPKKHFDTGKEVANAFGTFTSKVRVSHPAGRACTVPRARPGARARLASAICCTHASPRHALVLLAWGGWRPSRPPGPGAASAWFAYLDHARRHAEWRYPPGKRSRVGTRARL